MDRLQILIRLPNWLGDAVMASAAIESLYRHFSYSTFYLVGSKAACDLYKHLPNTQIVIDQTKYAKSRIVALYKLAKEVPRADLSITFQNTTLSALLLFFNGAKIRIGYNRFLGTPLLTHKINKDKNIHQVDRYLKLITDLCPSVSRQPILHFSKLPLPNFLSGINWIGINAGGAYGSAKRWDLRYFVEVICYLLDKNYRVVLFGTKAEAESNEFITQQILAKKYARDLVLDLTQKTDIPTLAGYLQSLKLLISNDSGIMHLASAFSIPTIALFGPTDFNETGPINPYAKILSIHAPCSPCKKRVCPLLHHRCMEDLTPQIVIEALKTMSI